MIIIIIYHYHHNRHHHCHHHHHHHYHFHISISSSSITLRCLVTGEIRREYLLQTHRSYLVDFNTTVEGAAFPTGVKIFGYGVER